MKCISASTPFFVLERTVQLKIKEMSSWIFYSFSVCSGAFYC